MARPISRTAKFPRVKGTGVNGRGTTSREQTAITALAPITIPTCLIRLDDCSATLPSVRNAVLSISSSPATKMGYCACSFSTALSAALSITDRTWASICSCRRCRLTRRWSAKHTPTIAKVPSTRSTKNNLITTVSQDNRWQAQRGYRATLHAHRERLGTVFLDAFPHQSVEAALQQRHQAGVPVSKHEQNEKRHGNVVLVSNGVPDSQRKVAANQHFDVRYPPQALAIFLGGYGRFLFAHDPILGSAGKGALMANQRFKYSLAVGDGQPDSERHQGRQEQKRAIPGFREQFLLRYEVETRDGKRGRQEQGQVNIQHLEPSLVEADNHRRQQQRAEHDHQRVAEVGSQVIPRFGLLAPGDLRPQYLRQVFLGTLDEALCPARLLGFERGHLDGQLRGTLHVLQVAELPSLQLRTVAQVGVFGEGIVFPAAGIVDRLAPPHSRGAVEVEEHSGARAPAVLQHKVAVQQDGLDLGQKRVVAVQVRPAGLHHADLGVGKVVDHFHQPLRRGREIGVEDGDKLASGDLQAGIERTCLVAFAIGAMVIADVVAQRRVAIDHGLRNLDRLVGGIIQHLDFQLFARVFQLADAVHQAINHVLFVEDWQLDRNPRQLREARRRLRDLVLAVLVIEVNQLVAMHAVKRQQDQHDEIRNQQRHVEGVGVVQSFERGVQEVGPKVMAQPARFQQQTTNQAEDSVQDVLLCKNVGRQVALEGRWAREPLPQPIIVSDEAAEPGIRSNIRRIFVDSSTSTANNKGTRDAMKFSGICFAILCLVVGCPLLLSGQASPSPSTTPQDLYPDQGYLSATRYANRYFGFAFDLPADVQLQPVPQPVARDGRIQMLQLAGPPPAYAAVSIVAFPPRSKTAVDAKAILRKALDQELLFGVEELHGLSKIALAGHQFYFYETRRGAE